MAAYRNATPDAVDEFTEARKMFEVLIEELRSSSTAALQHGEVETLVVAKGRECLRLLVQGHLDRRAAQERPPSSVRTGGGDELTHRRKRQRRLLTLVGPVVALRTIFSARRGAGLAPLDAELNLPSELYSHGLRRLAAVEAARGSFDATVEAIQRATGETVPKRQAEQLAQRAARDFDAFYEKGGTTALASSDDLLVMSLDAKGVVMRAEHLRPVTQRRAERGQHKLKTRLSTGEKRDRKRMATVSAIYDVAPYVRRPEDIIASTGESRTAAMPRPRPRNKRVSASLARSAEQVTTDLFAEAKRRDLDQRRKWVVLVDGDRHQIARVKSAARQAGVEITLVVDFIHVMEYLWNAAWGFFSPGDAAAETWVLQRARRILEGKSSDVAAGIRRSATLRKIPVEKRTAIDECVDYLIKKRAMIHYDEYLAAGLPISTGVIEGACRHLVVDRMDITGARWSLDGAEAILRLRSLRSSGDFDEYWRFHLEREQRRTHADKYAASRETVQ